MDVRRPAVCLVLVLLSFAACTETVGPGTGVDPTPATATPSGTTGSSQNGYVRTCESGVYGALHKGFRKGSLVAGPVILIGQLRLDGAPGRYFRTRSGKPKPMKVLLLVREGPVAVTMSIIQSDRPFVALLYNPKRFNTNRLAPAERSITFVSCDKGSHPHNRTQFNGAFLVDGPRCVGVRFDVEGRPDPIVRQISFGAGDC